MARILAARQRPMRPHRRRGSSRWLRVAVGIIAVCAVLWNLATYERILGESKRLPAEAEGEANVTAHLRAQELTAPSSEAEAMARRRALRFALDRTEAALRGRTPPATPPAALEGESAVRAIVRAARGGWQVAHCPEVQFETLEHAGEGPVLIALNLHENAPVMPHLVLSLCDLLLRLSPPHGDAGAFLSIYESGSTDATPAWLDVTEALLRWAGLPGRVVRRGEDTRRPTDARITFLARMRNHALAPLLDAAPSRDAPSALARRASKVLFVNDVFLCAEHGLRLLRHVRPHANAPGRDMACALDFHLGPLEKIPRVERRHIIARDMVSEALPPPVRAPPLPVFGPPPYSILPCLFACRPFACLLACPCSNIPSLDRSASTRRMRPGGRGCVRSCRGRWQRQR